MKALDLDLLPDPTVVVDATGTVVGANRLATRLAGALHGRPAAEALPLVDEAGEDWWACTRPLAADPRLLPRVPEVDLRLGAGGRPVTLTAARVAGEHGGVDLLVLSLRRADRRARLDASRSELVASMSHELRSPLTSVRGFTKTLLARWERFSDEQRRLMVATIHEDAERVTRLLGELLDVSRIDAGRLRPQREMIDVGQVVERVLARCAVARADLPAGLPRLYADPDRLEQVLTHLAEDAVHRGAQVVTFSTSIGAGAEVLTFTVTDDGAAVPAGGAFSKSMRTGRGAGSGLARYISKGFVEAHGGRIWAHDGGSSFELPLGGLELAGVPAEVHTAVDPPDLGGKVQA